jgi:hypothetical protein
LDNKERALLTYNAIQKKKQDIKKNKDLEIKLYQLDNIRKIRRRIN